VKGFFKHRTFQYFDGEIALFSAKSSRSKVQIMSSAAPSQLCGILKSKKWKHYFELVGTTITERFVCQVGSVHEPVSYHRYFVMDLTIGEEQQRLHSKMPKNAGGGKYTLNFGGKFTKSSIRNAILIDGNEQNAIIVRKIGKEDLEVECLTGLSDFVCFGFAILSWTCPY
jgi:hypothetical protein